MTASTGWSLQRGIYQALANSSELGALLGGTRIYDDAPQATSYPFITLGQSLVRDWSTGTEDRAEHLLTLHVWSRAGGKKQQPETRGPFPSSSTSSAPRLASPSSGRAACSPSTGTVRFLRAHVVPATNPSSPRVPRLPKHRTAAQPRRRLPRRRLAEAARAASPSAGAIWTRARRTWLSAA